MTLPHTSLARKLYTSRSWRRCRLAYLDTVNHICERCGRVADIVHHKEYIDSTNVSDPEITLNFENLEALCQTCHNQEHFKEHSAVADGYQFDEFGNIQKFSD